MSEKINSIQGIRALAMLGIFFTHTYVWLTDDIGWFAPIASQLGGFGVVTFFIISGFLFAYKNHPIPLISHRHIIKSAWHKVDKLYGLYLITFLVAFISRFPSSARVWVQNIVSLPFTLTLSQDFVPFSWIINSFNGPSWFLSAFLGIWIIMYLTGSKINILLSMSPVKCILVGIIVLLLQYIWLDIVVDKFLLPIINLNHYTENWCDWLKYNNPLLCFSEFLLGIILGSFLRKKQISASSQNGFAVLAFFLSLIYFFCVVNKPFRFVAPWIVVIEIIICIGIIAVMSPNSVGARLLSIPALTYFGNVSGYFFLIHGATNFALGATIADYISKPWMFFMSFAVSIIFSICADYYYSKRKPISRINDENA